MGSLRTRARCSCPRSAPYPTSLQWGNLSLKVRGHELKVVRLQFLKQTKA